MYCSSIERVQFENIKKRHQENLREDAKDKISKWIRKYREYVIESTTKAFQATGFRDKNGGYTNYLGGKYKNGFLIIPVNTSGIRKQVVNQNIPRLQKAADKIVNYYFYGAKAEFREITKEDLKRLNDSKEQNLVDLEDKFLGLMGIIIEFDYDKWLENLLK